jgi:spore germination protein
MDKREYLQLKSILIDGISQYGDTETRHMDAGDRKAELLYIKTLCDAAVIHRYIVSVFWEMKSLQEYGAYLSSFPNCEKGSHLQTATELILRGFVAVFLDSELYLFDAMKVESSSISEATVEATIQGPQDAFNGNLLTEISMVRRRYQSDALQVELYKTGELSKTNLAMLYDQNIVNQQALEELRGKLDRVHAQLVQSAGELQQNLSPKKFALFPMIVVTERPDRVVRFLSKGRIAVLVDGTPFAMLLPSIFSDFFTAMDDYVQMPVIGHFLKILRYIGFAFTVLLPALYVGTVSYNPEFYRVQLAFSIGASRAAVPYASYLEVFFMLIMMEFLTEASIRLPKSIGPTATTVGGLILGQAASQAGLISNIMIIIVAVVAVSNYVIPIIEMNFAVRVLKYFMVLFAAIGGLVGIVVGVVVLVFYLASLTSYGTPYVRMIRKGEDS